MKTNRTSKYHVADFILNRWSPRAMSGKEISDEQLMRLFEAAGWAQSSYNGQPWRFIYTKRNTPAWNTFFNLLVSANQEWAKNASVLVVVISRKNFEYNNKPSRTHSFDAGAACQNLALQGAHDNLVVHGMEGFDYDRAKQDLKIPDDYQVEAMFAIGYPGDVKDLPLQLQEKEKPSGRKEVKDIIFESSFKE